MSTSLHKQYLRARTEVDSSMANARNLLDQWLAATTANPTQLAKKDIDYLGKAFKNRLLTVKWDCEDLEELVGAAEQDSSSLGGAELVEAKRFIAERRLEISRLMSLLEESEATDRQYNKHGLSPLHASRYASIAHHDDPLLAAHHIDEASITQEAGEEVQFDKNQVAAGGGGPTIFTNALYDHLEREDQQLKGGGGFNSSEQQQSSPVTNVYMNPNENETILDMLETEYYNPPAGLNPRARVCNTVRKFLETDRNKFLGTIAFLFSFPLLMVILFIA